jgi:hypothetical protein
MIIIDGGIKMLKKMLVLFSISLMVTGTALAHEEEGKKDGAVHVDHQEQSGDQQVPQLVTIEHWSCKEIGTGEKYEQRKNCPGS